MIQELKFSEICIGSESIIDRLNSFQDSLPLQKKVISKKQQKKGKKMSWPKKITHTKKNNNINIEVFNNTFEKKTRFSGWSATNS